MYKLRADKFMQAFNDIAVLAQTIVLVRQILQNSQTMQISEQQVEEFKNNIIALHDDLTCADMPISAVSANEIIEIYNRLTAVDNCVQFTEQDLIGLERHLDELRSRIRDEFITRTVLVLPYQEGKRYQMSQELFGIEVINKFPSAAYEIDEAGKCLALGRLTACVFHLMRALEVGIEGTRKCLGIPDPVKDGDRNWGSVLNKFKGEFERRNKAGWDQQEDKDFFAEIHASLDAVKNVWRNATMHVEKKYTDEEAEHIFNAVRGFMKKLAVRLDEQGQPLA